MEREETNSMLIVATIFCLQLPRATHALSSDKLDDLLVYVAREAITKGVSRKRGKEKTDMFSLGFICEINEFKHPKSPKHVCWRRGGKQLLGRKGKG